MSPPAFSVVIPTYNRAGLIGRTLDTVFAQSLQDFEVIVVDNCSTDDTAAVITPYERTGKLRFICHDRNYERARSRNTGLDAATGEFVTFLDSDDLMYPNNLADAHAFARAHPALKVFHNLYELVDPLGNVLHRYRYPSIADPVKAIAEGNFMSCIGDFIHRDVYPNYRFDTDPVLSGSEDWHFWLRLIADHPVGRIPKVNSGIVDHSGRTMNSLDLGALRSRISHLLAAIQSDPHLFSIYAPHRRFMEASALLFMASVANSNGEYREALRLVRQTLVRDARFVATRRFARTLQIALFRLKPHRPAATQPTT